MDYNTIQYSTQYVNPNIDYNTIQYSTQYVNPNLDCY